MAVIAAGDLWIVNSHERTAVRMLPALAAILEVHNPKGWIFSRQGIALARFGPKGLMWHTRRLSWDGFDQLEIVQHELRGLAWSPIEDKWYPFGVEFNTGKSVGGSCFLDDAEGWEVLAS